jgi:type II secretory pathway component GspD/PulD (secretin)
MSRYASLLLLAALACSGSPASAQTTTMGSATTQIPSPPYGSTAPAATTVQARACGDGRASIAFSGPLPRLVAALSGAYSRNIITDGSLDSQQIVGFAPQCVTLNEALGMLKQKYQLVESDAGNTVYLSSERTAALHMTPVVLPLHNAIASEVSSQISGALGQNGIVIADTRTNSLVYLGGPTGLTLVNNLVKTLDEQANRGTNTTAVIRVSHISADDAVKDLKGALGSRGASVTVVADDDTNSVVITGPQGLIDEARGELFFFDVTPHYVDVVVTVYDVQPRNDAKNVGTTFGSGHSNSTNTTSGTTVNVNGSGSTSSGSTSGSASGTGTISFTPNIFNALFPTLGVGVQLNTLNSIGTSKVLASPNILLRTGKTGKINVGQTYPSVFQGTGALGGTTVTTVNTGVILNVTATSIGADGSIAMDLHAEYSQITGFVQTYPIIGQRFVDTSLVGKSGQQIVFGGLTSSTETRTVTKVPLLGDIPLFGALFRNVQTSNNDEEIVFSITPYVVASDAVPADSR